MLTLRRTLFYCVLLFPVAFYLNLTFLERRLAFYSMLSSLALVFAGIWIADRVATKRVEKYRQWRAAREAAIVRLHRRGVLGAITVLALPGLSYAPIGYGLYPAFFRWIALVLGVWVLATLALRKRMPAALKPDLPLLVLIPALAGIGSMGVNAYGSTDATCEGIEANPLVRPIVTRRMIVERPEIEDAFPYDVKSDPAADRLFFTLKQRRSGFLKMPWRPEAANDAIGVTSFTEPDFSTATLIPISSDSTGTYPQRITVDAARGRIYVVVLDVDGDHTIRVIDYRNGFEQVAEIRPGYEPIRVYLDEARNRLLILNYEGAVGVYDRDTFEQTLYRKVSRALFMGLIDTFVHHAERRAYYASSVSGEFLLLSEEFLAPLIERNIKIPTIGLDYDPATDRVYAAGTLTREIAVLNGETLELEKTIPTGTTVRELYLDLKRRLIVTAGYTDGRLDLISLDDHDTRASIEVGRLARSIHLESGTGRVFAASGCGLFEVLVDRMLTEADSRSERDLPGAAGD
ncbi:MAG: hypothetical protein KJ042_15110 [Deltaproteobacteria bacterium]|nr:hypothetical protein [Deltaproteobacteria bacterium]